MLDENSKDYFREKAVLSSKSASNFTHNIRIVKLALNNLVMLNWKKVSSCKETNIALTSLLQHFYSLSFSVVFRLFVTYLDAFLVDDLYDIYWIFYYLFTKCPYITWHGDASQLS